MADKRVRTGNPARARRALAALLGSLLALGITVAQASDLRSRPAPPPASDAPSVPPGKPPRNPDTAPRAAKATDPSLSWHDGTHRRMLTLEPGLEADFTPRTGRSGVIQPSGTASAASTALTSPVLRDETGRLRALPGGVLVTLKTPLDEAAARRLLAQAGVVPVRRVSESVWLVEAPTGLESLQLANRLHDSGMFLNAEPNWWSQRSRK
jgi:hypothetical protein